MSNSEKRNKEKRKKKALKNLYQKIQKETENVINQCIASSSSIEFAYQAAPEQTILGLLRAYNLNLIYVKETTEIDYFFRIEPSSSIYNRFGQLYELIIECEKIIEILKVEDTDKKIPEKIINKLNSLKYNI